MNNEIINQEIEKEGSIVWKSIVGLLILPIVALVVVPWFAYSVGFTKADYMCLLAFLCPNGYIYNYGLP